MPAPKVTDILLISTSLKVARDEAFREKGLKTQL